MGVGHIHNSVMQQLLLFFVFVYIVYSNALQPVSGTLETPTCFVPSGRDNCAPYFVIVGSMKCGTTSLFSYLQNHPQVLPLKSDAKLNNRRVLANKEVRFFLDPLYSSLVQSKGANMINDYYDLFSEISPANNTKNGFITGEATPMYVCSTGVAERVKSAFPYGKMIWMMRNPTDRAYSDFWFRNLLTLKNSVTEFQFGTEEFKACSTMDIHLMNYCNISSFIENPTIEDIKNFEACVGENSGSIVNRRRCDEDIYGDLCQSVDRTYCNAFRLIKNGLYYYQIIEWLKYFDSDNLLVFKSEDFYHDTEKVMNRVTEFLGLQPLDWSGIVGTAYNIIAADTASVREQEVLTTVGGMGVGVTTNVENSERYPPLDAETRSWLDEFFEPYNKKLAELFPDVQW